jgi:hypothetical protein
MSVCDPKPKNTAQTVKDRSDRVNKMHQRASNAAAANDLRHGARWCGRIHIRVEAP